MRHRLKQKKRHRPYDSYTGSNKCQRSAGQPVERHRSRGPAVAAAAAAFQGASTPTLTDPAACRGPTPGRAPGTGWAPSLEGSSEGASSSKDGSKHRILETTSKASGAAPKISGCQYFHIGEEGKASGSAGSSAAPAVPAVSELAGMHGEPAAAPAGHPA
eukprot:2095335-Pyramimonas_sp.AAC.1